MDLNKDLLSLVGGSADIGEFDWLSPPEEILRCDRDGFQGIFDDMLGVADTHLIGISWWILNVHNFPENGHSHYQPLSHYATPPS